MDYNPLTARLLQSEQTISSLRSNREAAAKELTWATEFQRDSAALDLTRLQEEWQALLTELERLEVKCSQGAITSELLATRTADLKGKAQRGPNPLKWFTKDHSRAKRRLQRHNEQVRRHLLQVESYDRRRNDREMELKRLLAAITAKKRDIQRFDEFNIDEWQETIGGLDEELLVREAEFENLKARKAEVDRRLEGPLAEMKDCGAEIGSLQQIAGDLLRQQKKVQAKRRKADKLDSQISSTSNGSDRSSLHAESEKLFGDSSPRRVVFACDRQLRELTSSLEFNGRQVARIDRDIAKIEARIEQIARVASRDIRLFIIDGKNLCFEDGAFIGLAALIPLTEQMAERFDVIVIFDASIRRNLARSDEQIANALPAAKVHVVASRAKADETILAAAHDSGAWVISNDRYADYRDKEPVKEQRVIRHEILNGNIMVHDLDLSIAFHRRGD